MAETQSYAELIAAAREATEELVAVERRDDHAVVRLSDPDRRNVLSAALLVQLRARTEELVADPAIRSVVLTGAGPAFCAGGDLRLMQEFVDGHGGEDGAMLPYRFIRRQFGGFARLLASSDTVFVAALNGPAAGVGLAFALACDVVLAARTAQLVPAFGRLGLVPEVGTSWALTRALGYRGAFAFYLESRPMDADRAAALGLVTEVVDPAELLARATRWCERVSAMPAHAIELAKPLLRNGADASWEQSLIAEEYAEPICFTTAGFADGVRTVTEAVHR